MPFTPPTGSGILLCPTGVGFSTISDEDYERIKDLEATDYGTIEQIDSEVYQEWLANAREIEDSLRVTYAPATSDYDDSYFSEVFKQGIRDELTLTSVEFNTSPHPLPMMLYSRGRLYFKPDINEGSVSETDDEGSAVRFGFGYYRLQDGAVGQVRNLPYVFIRNDNFYWFSPKIFADGANESSIVSTLSSTEYKSVYTVNLEAFPEGASESIPVIATFTKILRITDPFY